MNLTAAEERLIQALRDVIAEQAGGRSGVVAAVEQAIGGKAPICGVPGRGGICEKPKGHGQRHRYTPPVANPHIPVQRSWSPLTSYRPEGSRFTLVVGNPVKVLGEGRKTALNPEGAAEAGWSIVRMEKHVETGKVNVEAKRDRNGHSRVFPVEKIVYVRPKNKP